jgi:hypothetical protein
LLPSSKAWRFAPDALERWKGEDGADFLARHLTDSAYLARLARLYLRAVCDPDCVWVIPGRLTALVRDKLGLNADAVLGRGGGRKDRTDHRHHAVDALVVGLCDRSLLQRVSTAARRAEERGRRLLDALEEPWPGFVAEASAKARAIVVSHKADTAPAGRLHNDTAYAGIDGAADGEPNVAHRVPIASFAGWRAEEVDAAVADARLAAAIKAALAAGDKGGAGGGARRDPTRRGRGRGAPGAGTRAARQHGRDRRPADRAAIQAGEAGRQPPGGVLAHAGEGWEGRRREDQGGPDARRRARGRGAAARPPGAGPQAASCRPSTVQAAQRRSCRVRRSGRSPHSARRAAQREPPRPG